MTSNKDARFDSTTVRPWPVLRPIATHRASEEEKFHSFCPVRSQRIFQRAILPLFVLYGEILVKKSYPQTQTGTDFSDRASPKTLTDADEKH